MNIDLSRFHAAFFDESFEGTDIMERGLLQLDAGGTEGVDAAKLESVNLIFRAAHSIKGGAATFGFANVAAFTHHVETLLDQMRSGTRATSRDAVDLLLRAVDVLRNLLTAARDGGVADTAAAAAVQHDLEVMLGVSGAASSAKGASAAAAPACTGFEIRFVARPELFRSGNDPLLILRELNGLGQMQARLETGRLPSFAEADPATCYLGWRVHLETSASRAQVQDLFAWVEDECELEITPVTGKPAAAAAAPAPAPVAATPVASPAAAAAAAPPAANAPAARTAPAPAKGNDGDGGSIRVRTDKIDSLINLVGELVITQAMLTQQANSLDPVANERLLSGLQQLDRNTRQLQEAVLSTRMLPIEAVFSRFPRMVRDLAARLGKQVRLETIGEATELDKSVIEKITDPLTHLVRNSIDHGVESTEARLAAGKPAEGTITLSAAHQGGHICIEVGDDGGGLNRERILDKARRIGLPVSDNAGDAEVWQLIFAPGFSTKEEITDVSGRGVGMDVVKRNIEALDGQVELESIPGKGTRARIRLPLTLAILDGMSISAGGETFIVPLNCVIESMRPTAAQLRSIGGSGRLLNVRDEYVPLVALREVFGISDGITDPQAGIVVVLEAAGRKIALMVDELLGQQQVVIKNLETNYRRVFGISGATILGDGRVALIIDASALIRSTWQAAAA